MATQITGWMCETCRTIHDTDVEATNCEGSHNQRDPIITSRHDFSPMKHSRDRPAYVPGAICVKFSDEFGDSARYVLEHYGAKGI